MIRAILSEGISKAWMRLYIELLAAFIVIGTCSPSEAANQTQAGTISACAADETSILVRMPYRGDDNVNNTYTVEYKACNEESFTPWSSAAHTVSPYSTTIFGLSPNTCYSIRATYNDPDGITGTAIQTIKISSTWDNTMLHNSNRFPNTTKWSGVWGTQGTGQYGQIVCATCHTRTTANIKRVKDTVIVAPDTPAHSFPAQAGGLGPDFLSTIAPRGFGDDTGGHAVSQKICEVCHSQNKYHNYNTANNTGDLSHNNNTDCIVCHKHMSGFASSCSDCHGNPPVVNSHSGPDGLAYTPATGSVTAGAHNVHTAKSVACRNCHYSSAGTGATHRDSAITLGFYLFGGIYQGGAYNGQTTAIYNATSTSPATVVTKTGAKTCSNIYCHGNYPGSGRNATPVWDGTVICGSCHNASNTTDPGTGKHGKHASSDYYEFKCTLCHKDIVGGTSPAGYTITDQSRHVNGYVDYKFDTTDPRVGGGAYSIATGTAAPTNGTTPRAFGSCNTIYCHSNVQPEGGVGGPSSYSNPSWASTGTAACGSCHAGGHGALIGTGSHSAHLAYAFTTSDTYKCAICHSWDQSQSLSCSSCHNFYAVPEYAKHANYKIEVVFDPAFNSSASYGKSPSFTPGTGYSNCFNTYCHSNGTSVSTSVIPSNASPNWGSVALTCAACHGYPPSYAQDEPKSNSHAAHLSFNPTCNLCHYPTTTNGSTITSTVNHVNGTYNVAPDTSAVFSWGGVSPVNVNFTYAYDTSGGRCSNISCHIAMGYGPNKTWGDVGLSVD
ncbi:MAG: CxxxxCH/CxxCH domain-containing protein [Nitrospirae bacterium]|nr:CxxxxCH/CxxCH domain-containing protein [Nitrospirota bacterium]